MSLITFNLPCNNLSFGQTSIAILREAYKAKLDCVLFPIGPVDLSAQVPDEGFNQWLNHIIGSAHSRHQRTNRTIKLWHCNGLLESYGAEQEAITFIETDQITETERHILSQQKIVWVTSNYTKTVMETYGLTNVKYLELGFDTHNFKKLDKKYYADGRKTIGIMGKWEARKNSAKILKVLAREYGNRPDIMIHAAVYNPFFSKEDNEKLINNALEGKKLNNFVFLPFMPQNAQYNDFLNSCDIVLGMSGGEGKDLPVLQAAALGKKVVALKAHAYLDYLNDNNAFLVKPNGKLPAVDGVFFHPNSQYNCGNFYSWDEKEFVAKLNEALVSEKPEKFKYKTYEETFRQLMNP